MLKLRSATTPRWTETVLADFDTFLQDHAACERKASAQALALALHYRDKRDLVREMVDLAAEEMDHFRQVYDLLEARGVPLGIDSKDPYVNALQKLVRKGSSAYFVDRMVLFAIVEARGCERFGLVADALPAGQLKEFYDNITRSEARHHALFLRLAKKYEDVGPVDERLAFFLDAEAHVVSSLELRPALH